MDCPLSEIFFGGARGGGKTDGVLGKWALKEKRYGAAFNAIMLRRTTVSSMDAIERSKEIYGPLGGKFNESKLRWRMPNGGRVSFAYLDSVDDAQAYQGQNITDVWIEEAGQFPNPDPIDRLFGVLRSAKGVPVQIILTANPGGAGQHWISRRYKLVPFPDRPQIVERTSPSGSIIRMAVIPSRVTDNRILLHSDPGYISRLGLVGSAALVRAWLEGDWNAVEGAFFDTWNPARNVVKPFEVPADWARFRSGDWGSAKPFAFYWFAVASDPYRVNERLTIPRGALVAYREWYGCIPGKENTGLKLTAEQVGQGLKERSGAETYSNSVFDPAAFAEDGGPSIASRIAGAGGGWWRPADNKRVSGRGAMGGWDQMRSRIDGTSDGPMLVFFSTCEHAVRTIPALQHDISKPEDLDTEAEDHAADAVRYGCMSRPWTAPAKTPEQKNVSGYTPRETSLPSDSWVTY